MVKRKRFLSAVGSSIVGAVRGAYKHRKVIGAAFKGAKRILGKRKASSSSSSRKRAKTGGRSGGVSTTSTRPGFSSRHGRLARKPSKSFRLKVLAATNMNYRYVETRSIAVECNAGYSNFVMFPHRDISHLNAIMDEKAISGATLGSVSDQTKFIINGSWQNITIANMSNTPAFLRLYEFVPRHDIPSNVDTPSNLVVNTIDDSVGLYQMTYQSLAMTFFMAPGFVNWFKIIRVKLVEIQPGQNFVFNSSWLSPKSINNGILKPTGCYAYRGITSYLGVQFWGGICDTIADHAVVTTAPIKLDFITVNKFHYNDHVVAQNWLSNYNTLTHPAANLLQDIDEATGAVQTIVSA